MASYSDYPTFTQFIAKEKIGQTINVSFKMPIPTEHGLQFPGSSGKLLAVFEDGVLMRAQNAERFFRFSDCHSIDFPSEIELARGSLV